MKRLVCATLLGVVLAGPAAADDGGDELRQGAELLKRGTELLLQGLMQELAPALEQLRDRIGDLSMYYPPEILPNGDIIIRRKVPLSPPLGVPGGDDEATDL